MVELKTEYELNHLYPVQVLQQEIAIGAAQDVSYQTIQLFNKSLALASDLKRLPILRGFSGSWSLPPALGFAMNASGVTEISLSAAIYNCKQEDIGIDKIIARFNAKVVAVAAAVTVIDFENIYDNIVGGILCGEELTIQLITTCNQVAAGAAFAADNFYVIAIPEIDWLPISKKQFEEFILESVYAKE